MDVILPVLNEAGAIPGVLADLPSGFEPLVVDNGSTDGSADIARSLGARAIEEPQRGFGSACFAGLKSAGSEHVAFMDCDGSFDPKDLIAVAEPVLDDELDLSLGARSAGGGAWPIHARLGNKIVTRRLRSTTGVSLKDLGPMRVARRAALLDLGIVDRRFGWPLEMIVRAARAGWRIGETPITYRPRTGKSKVTGTLSGTLTTARDMTAILR